MFLDVHPEKCTGCRACEVFCSLEHEGLAQPELSRIRILKDELGATFLPIVCPPCAGKPCLQACPEPGAMLVTTEGTVIIDESLCTGCSKCIRACDLGAVRFHRLRGRGKHGKAVALKCDLCDGDPWCVKVCEPGALTLWEGAEDEGTQVFERLLAALSAGWDQQTQATAPRRRHT